MYSKWKIIIKIIVEQHAFLCILPSLLFLSRTDEIISIMSDFKLVLTANNIDIIIYRKNISSLTILLHLLFCCFSAQRVQEKSRKKSS